MKREPSYAVPWIFLVAVLMAYVRGRGQETDWMLFMIAVYALFDIVRTKGEGAVLLHWCVYACALGAILLWSSCAAADWGAAIVIGGSICALAALVRYVWKHMT